MSSAALVAPADPAIVSQANFRALMDAMARPGTVQKLRLAAEVPAPLSPELAALAVMLCDHETTLWLDPVLAATPAVVDYLRFETGTRLVADPAEAAFALVSDMALLPPLVAFAVGSDDYPDRSTTLLLAVATLEQLPGRRIIGPGIDGEARLGVSPWPASLDQQLVANRALFPRGVDLVFAAAGAVAALPRTTAISEG